MNWHPEILTRPEDKWPTRICLAFVIGIAVLFASSPAWSGQRGVSLAGVVPTLADKAREIVSACGSVVVSAVSRRPNKSNHGIGRAVDISNNPKCIYAHLAGWKGGYSTDYSTVRCDGKLCPHVHISWNPGGMEWGVRFAHRDPFGNGKTRRVRFAHAGQRTER